MSPVGTVTDLYHANDAAIVYFNKNGVNTPYIFVAAYNPHGTNYVVKLGFNSSGSYWEVARYPLPDNNRLVGITLLSGGGTTPATFLIKGGDKFYEATISDDKPTDSLLWDSMPEMKFALAANGTSGSGQGIHYEPSNGKLYFACSGTSGDTYTNRVYIYHNALNLNTDEGENGVGFDESLIIRNLSQTYFEIEGIAFRPNTTDDKLWFLTFEGDSKNGGVYTDMHIAK